MGNIINKINAPHRRSSIGKIKGLRKNTVEKEEENENLIKEHDEEHEDDSEK